MSTELVGSRSAQAAPTEPGPGHAGPAGSDRADPLVDHRLVDRRPEQPRRAVDGVEDVQHGAVRAVADQVDLAPAAAVLLGAVRREATA